MFHTCLPLGVGDHDVDLALDDDIEFIAKVAIVKYDLPRLEIFVLQLATQICDVLVL